MLAALATEGAGQSLQFPGTVQAEDFDKGNEGTAYLDTTPGNTGGKYRSTNVDIEVTTDTGGGHDVGWTTAGEWLNYTVRVTTAAVYDIEVRVASKGPGGTFHIEIDGVDRTGPFTVPDTGAWQNWTSIHKTGVKLNAGMQVWRLVMDQIGTAAVGNINFIRVRNAASSAPPAASPAPAGPAPAAVPVPSAAANRAGGTNPPPPSTSPAPVTTPPPATTPIPAPVTNPPPATTPTPAPVTNPPATSAPTTPTPIPSRNPPPNTPPFPTAAPTPSGPAVSSLPAAAPPPASPPAVSNPPGMPRRSASLDPPGEDIVLYSSDVSTSVGNWARVSYSSAADGAEMRSNNLGSSNPKQPVSARGDYFEARFMPEAGRLYRVWLRLRALEDSKDNDSVWVQFSGAVGADGSPQWRIGTNSGLLVNLESCDGCSVSGWGWRNGAWWLAQDALVRFPAASEQVVRVQSREDGTAVDQILLSPTTYFDAPPGLPANDTTVLRKKAGPANRTPATSITSPADGATFPTPATIQITASASDRNGTVTHVEFYAGKELLFTDTATPWTVTWKNMPPGAYSLTAVAVDEMGAKAASDPVNITVGAAANRPPIAAMANPPDGATYVAPAGIVVSATASATNGTIAMVEFYASNQLIGSDATAPYAVTWDNVLPGTYTLTAIARDNTGVTGISPVVTITVREPVPAPSPF